MSQDFAHDRLAKKAPDQKYCADCGSIIHQRAEICPKCGIRQENSNPFSGDGKNKVVAGVLAILLGGLGVHKFYLGKTIMGIIYLLFCWTGIPSIVGIIEGIIYLVSSDSDFKRKYGSN